MKKIFYIFIFLIFQNNIIFASFPVNNTDNFSKVEITYQFEDGEKELTKKQKISLVFNRPIWGYFWTYYCFNNKSNFKKEKTTI